uniref:Uncharacterized protein n=1 Tax=Parastrongyloides trichosuri TaxID=131310 RepID=A0A0N4ZK06_PARTI
MREIVSICQNYPKFEENNKKETFEFSTHELEPTYQKPLEWHPLRAVSFYSENSIIKSLWRLVETEASRYLYNRFFQSSHLNESIAINGGIELFINMSQAIYRKGIKGTEPYVSKELYKKLIKKYEILESHQQNLFNITKKDILGVCPGVVGGLQHISSTSTHLYYHLFFISLYKRNLFPQKIRNPSYILTSKELTEALNKNPNFYERMPLNYGYSSPKFINFHCVIKHEYGVEKDKLKKAEIDMFGYFIH